MMHGTQGAGYPSLCEGRTSIELRECECPGWAIDGPFRSIRFFSMIERAILICIVSWLCACNYCNGIWLYILTGFIRSIERQNLQQQQQATAPK